MGYTQERNMRTLYTFSLVLLLGGAHTLRCNTHIDTIRNTISDIFSSMEYITSPSTSKESYEQFETSVKDDIDTISKAAPKIDIKSFETWCDTKDKQYLHPVVQTIFEPFYAGFSIPNEQEFASRYAQYTQASIEKAIEIMKIITDKKPEMTQTEHCIVHDLIYKIKQGNTFDAFNRIAVSKNAANIYRTIHERLTTLFSHIPAKIWHYTDTTTPNTPLDICINELDLQVQVIHFIKSIVEATPEDILNKTKYLHYGSDILAHMNISNSKLKDYPEYLKTTAETIDILYKKQKNLLKEENSDEWPIYGFADNIEEFENNENISKELRNNMYHILDVLYQHGGAEQFVTPVEDDALSPIDQSTIISNYYKWHQQKADVGTYLSDLYHHIAYLEQQVASRR